MALLSTDEVKDFALQLKYTEDNPKWPRKTTLLYQLLITGTSPNRTAPSTRKVKWLKKTNTEHHAEENMLISIEERIKKFGINGFKISGLHVDVVLSYSPCNEKIHRCADKLINFKNTFRLDCFEKNATINMRILIANIYKSYHKPKLVALSKLHEAGIILEVFHGRLHWEHFLGTIVGLRGHEYGECLRLAKLKGRSAREEVDVRILEAVKMCAGSMSDEDDESAGMDTSGKKSKIKCEEKWKELGLKNIGMAKSVDEADRILLPAKLKMLLLKK